jgi:acetyl-CoA/propionyl-CoA carboxylase biotin carboxyl carrier protein
LFTKVLVANRGEIALRIVRALREMSIESVAVYSDADRESRFVLEADEAFRIGPAPAPQSYLNQDVIIAVAQGSGAQAIHPGYGFLAENTQFAEAVADAGLTFIGPSPESMRLMGDKIAGRMTAVSAGVPVVPGTDGAVESLDQAHAFVERHGLPVLVKAGGGGGGRGIRVVDTIDQLETSLEAAAREAETYFSNRQVYLERLYTHARHIEVQIAGDVAGNVVAWGERDCSTQRRRQKLIEETPAPGLSDDDRAALHTAAVNLARVARYVGVGTVEFLFVGPGTYYFLEMNARIQVEHTITEEVTGRDLVVESIRLALGLPATRDIVSHGHAIEARINAEDASDNFRPGPGRIDTYREPGGPGVRIDSGVYEGYTIPGDYDSLISKLVVHAPDRDAAIRKMLGALRGYTITGVPTTVTLVANILASDAFRAGNVTTNWLDTHLADVVGEKQHSAHSSGPATDARELDLEVNGKRYHVCLFESGATKPAARTSAVGRTTRRAIAQTNQVVSPMRGTVLAITKIAGDEITEGETLVVVEAMKMENEVRAPRSGIVGSVQVAVGETVENLQLLMELKT